MATKTVKKKQGLSQSVSITEKRSFQANYIENSYDKKVELHHHDYLEIYLFLDGSPVYQIEGRQYEIHPNDILIINSGDLHKPIFKNGKTNYSRYIFKITKTKLQTLNNPSLNILQIFNPILGETVHLLTPNVDEIENITFIFKRLCQVDIKNEFGTGDMNNCIIKELFIYLNRMYLRKQMRAGKKEQNVLDDVLIYIANNLETELSTEQISKQFYISKFYLSREFKKYVGATMHRYVVQKKLILSKELILKGMPIKDIYKKCGFADYCNFFRAFKNEYNTTPHKFYMDNIGL